MSGPLCPPLGDAACPAPGRAAEGDGFPPANPVSPARLHPSPGLWPGLRRALGGASLVAALGACGLALAGGLVAGGWGALAGGAAALLAAGLLLARIRRLADARDAAEARAMAAEAEQRRIAGESLAKSCFLAEMSHELRTPLNTVMGFSEMMADEVLGPHRIAAYGGYARDIHASGRHLLALADDLLDLARIESGHRTLMETPVALDQVAEACLAMMRPLAAAADVTLDLAAPAPCRLWGDERAVRQIVLNLLANAVKFTPAGGQVALRVGADGEGAPFLAVEDTGPGIDERELPLGAPHPRESRLDVASGRGAGLGLAIVRGLAGLHGGTLTLVRRAGGGTRARVSFPAVRALGRG